MKTRSETTHEDDSYVYGRTFVQMNEGGPWEHTSNWMRSKRDLWFIGHPQEVLARLEIQTDRKRAEEFADLINGDINGFYYLATATPKGTGDESLKWIMGALAAKLNEIGLGFDQVDRVLPADYLAVFIEYLKAGKFDKSFAKDVFAYLLAEDHYDWENVGWTFLAVHDDEGTKDACEFTWEEWQEFGDDLDLVVGEQVTPKRRFSGYDLMDRIVKLPQFQAADGSEIDAIIESVLAANPENAEKVKTEPKLIQWFVGQVMKASKGKAPAPVVLEKLKGRFGG